MDTLLRIVRTWRPSERPEYRGFRCANCQRPMRKAWHHWLDASGYKTPVHFCPDCEKKFRSGKIEHTNPEVKISRKTFGLKFPASVAKKLRAASARWDTEKRPEYRTFTCDECGRRMHNAWHVWSNDRGTLVEVHFCKNDGRRMCLDEA
ncbi:MAG: hypothetical protein NT016_03705 [Candidatus Aenigmarchaeota archaeon]|nr:hypothetical protein [Candidatus Aenigmarchaeota archaeon]